MDNPIPSESPVKENKLRSFGRWVVKARKPLIVSATLLLLVGVVVFSQYSDTIIVSINRFFAFEEKNPNVIPTPGDECIDANDCFAIYGDPSTQGASCTDWVCRFGTCRPSPTGCNASSTPTPTPTPQQHLACQNRQCVLVNGGGADQCSDDTECDFGPQQHLACRNQQCVLVPGPGNDQCADDSECVSSTPTPTASPTPTSTPGGSDPCAGRQTNEVNGVRFCVLEANFGGGVCTTNPSGTLYQRVGISDSGDDPMHVVYIGFHDNARGCSATTSQGINVGKSGTTDYPTPHSRGTFRIEYGSSRFDCGRVQLDSSFTNDGNGSWGLWLGEVIDYGQNCGATPTPTPTQHLACRNQQCVLVNGGGADQCSDNSECVTVPPTPTATPIKNVACVSHTIPTSLNAGQTVPVTMTLRNTGTVAWTQQTPANYDLTLYPWPPTTPSVSPQAMDLPVASVPPNGTATFSFNLTAPATQGIYNAQYRLVEQGIGWIGDICGTNISVTTATTPTPTLTSSSTPTISATPTPTPVPLDCAPKTQDVAINSQAILAASGGTSDQYNWTAANGNPPSGTSATFGVSYAQAGSYQVLLSQGAVGSRQAICTVNVVVPPATLTCVPSTQSVIVGQVANFTALVSGGDPTARPAWTAPGGNPTGGVGFTFSTQYFSPGSRSVTVAYGSQQATCPVEVVNLSTPTPTPTASNPALSLSKLVRNITQNTSELDAVAANPTDTVEFVIRVVSYGNATVNNVRLTDVLPANVSYLSGTTTIDGSVSTDITVSGGLSLGDMAPGRTVTVRFRAQVAAESAFPVGTTTLINTATATSNNAGSPSDVAFVNVNRATGAGGTIQINLQKLGRNITRGEFAEQSSVTSFPNQTIEFIIRARSLSSTRVNNVVLRDVIPSRVTYINGSTSLNGVAVNDALISSSGLNIGSLDPNQEAIVRFSGRVSPGNQLPLGTSTAINTVRLTADGVPEITAQLPIIIINGIAGVTQVQTGPGESLAVALAVALLVTLMYVTYTRTGTFKRRELKATIKEQQSGEDRFNFKV